MGRPLLRNSLYFRVLVAIALGVVVGHLAPATGVQMKALGDGFIKLIKMLIAPIVFSTIVVGIANMGDLRSLLAAWQASRSSGKVTWRFTTADARIKLRRLYPSIP